MITIQELREMDKREFAKTTKYLKKNDMIQILEAYGVWVKSTSKADCVFEVLLDVVYDIVVPSENDKVKIERKLNRRNKRVSQEDEYKKYINSLSDLEKWLLVTKQLFEEKDVDYINSGMALGFKMAEQGANLSKDIFDKIENKNEWLCSIVFNPGAKNCEVLGKYYVDFKNIIKIVHPDKAQHSNHDFIKECSKNFSKYNEMYQLLKRKERSLEEYEDKNNIPF